MKIKSLAVVGEDPVIMLHAPIPATRKVLERAKLSIDQIDLYEVNEVFFQSHSFFHILSLFSFTFYLFLSIHSSEISHFLKISPSFSQVNSPTIFSRCFSSFFVSEIFSDAERLLLLCLWLG
jgi:hypothetical protein